MTLRERQDEFISNMAIFDNWTERFNYLISLGDEMLHEMPEYLFPHRIEGCQSKTCFYARINDKLLYTSGWSNSAVMRGVIMAMNVIFKGISPEELRNTEIDFHSKSGLIDNITPMRQSAIEEMIRRITVLLG